ncbi:MAG: radical SAM protein [Clostridia bacterium]|nr:radical SAM protein [Clostridia bacterium]
MKTVKGYIKRKSMLYKTDVEYGDYTMNHVLGCSHGCKYPCYAFMMARRFGKTTSYEDWLEPYLVSNTLEILDKEIPRLKSRINSVHLCFTTDPFMYGYEEIKNMSLAAIRKLNDAGIKCTVLTKGLLPSELVTFSKENEYGITLISLNEGYRKRIEPGAASYKDRLEALRYLHDQGCKTWVSIEPYPTPNLIEQDLNDILEVIAFTDKIIFGRTNYSKEITSYQNHRAFYNEQAEKVINFCTIHSIQYHIKEKTISKPKGTK